MLNLHLSDDLRPIYNQRKRAERDVDLSPSDTVINLRDLGFHFTVVVETDEDRAVSLTGTLPGLTGDDARDT